LLRQWGSTEKDRAFFSLFSSPPMTERITNVKTLTQYLLGHIPESGRRSELAILFIQISLATKVTANAIRRAALESLLGGAGTVNIQGEDVKKLDLVANDAFRNAMVQSELISAIASEEDDDIILIHDGESGKYTISFDPLDGSSNIDANVSIGSIFGIMERTDMSRPASKEDLLRPGSKQIAAGYSLYGSSTMLVFTLGDGVNGFTLDNSLGEFILTHPDIQVPISYPIYSVNEGNAAYWDEATTTYVNQLKSVEGGKKSYSSRYIGSMVADVHRTLLYGGVFMYPADKKSPNGKLRYLYEVSPLSLVMEQAGGASVVGAARALDITPSHIHMRVPCFMGSKEDIDVIQRLYQEQDQKQA